MEDNNEVVVCSNCFNTLSEEDKYCPKCGAKRNALPYDPEKDVMMCIYGPCPSEIENTCKKCGYNWTVFVMIDNYNFCPKCGSNDLEKKMK